MATRIPDRFDGPAPRTQGEIFGLALQREQDAASRARWDRKPAEPSRTQGEIFGLALQREQDAASIARWDRGPAITQALLDALRNPAPPRQGPIPVAPRQGTRRV